MFLRCKLLLSILVTKVLSKTVTGTQAGISWVRTEIKCVSSTVRLFQCKTSSATAAWKVWTNQKRFFWTSDTSNLMHPGNVGRKREIIWSWCLGVCEGLWTVEESHLSCDGGDEGRGSGSRDEREGVTGRASRICRWVEGQTHRNAEEEESETGWGFIWVLCKHLKDRFPKNWDRKMTDAPPVYCGRLLCWNICCTTTELYSKEGKDNLRNNTLG